MVFSQNIVDFKLLFSVVFERTKLLLLYYKIIFRNQGVAVCFKCKRGVKPQLNSAQNAYFSSFQYGQALWQVQKKNRCYSIILLQRSNFYRDQEPPVATS